MTYPSVLRRYLAALLDLAVIWICVLGLTRISAVANSSWGMPAAAATVIVLYEPLFTSFLCTLGQALMRFRVVDHEKRNRVPLVRVYTRVIVKYVLGFISALTIPARSDRRAIHDLTVDSIVVDVRSLP